MAKTYLATALAQNVVPQMTTPENLKNANQAIDLFKEVLEKHPNDADSMKHIAAIYYEIKDLDAAEQWQKKVLAVDPKDPDAAYWIGMIDWTKAHQNKLNALQAAGLNDDGKGNVKAPKKVMEPLAKENKPLVDEGLTYLTLAVKIRPNYDQAMQMLNLIYRNKADVDYGNASAVNQDLAMAQDWTTKAMGTRKANEAKKNQGPGGITMDESGQMH
jgi:tetratricopeptide (TPR) repeat protein